MAYKELVKSMEHVRDYMRAFYIYGFHKRDGFTSGSARSYDDEKRRIESWLGEYMCFRRDSEGKEAFLSIDSRQVRRNPLYQAWKAKTFTDGDIVLHFILFDILQSSERGMNLSEIEDELDRYLHQFPSTPMIESSKVRRKLKEYYELGMLTATKEGKKIVYALRSDEKLYLDRAGLDFFSEVVPCSVVGSFLLDRMPKREGRFVFKHHYITSALDAQVLCALLDAISKRCFVTASTASGKDKRKRRLRFLPLRILVSVQSGRQYIMTWYPAGKAYRSIRIDALREIECEENCEDWQDYRDEVDDMRRHMWGVTAKKGGELSYVEFTVQFGEDEGHILKRLKREKRCGRVKLMSPTTARFSAYVYDAGEMIPWIRTFLCRIISISLPSENLMQQFRRDLDRMYHLYGIGGDDDALQ